MPLFDLLHLTEVVKPGAWVVLHDIDLPHLHPEFQVFGPRLLFEAWPFSKVKATGSYVSIGAIQLPEDPAPLVDVALSLLEHPWEHLSPTLQVGLPALFAKVEEKVTSRLAASEGAAA
jgi:hypothetical protein